VTTNVDTAAGTGDQAVDLRDPYPFFARKRREAGVLCGTVMDYSKTPEPLLPKRVYSVMSFDGVNKVFRDGQVLSSEPYDQTIELFMGPAILAMGGKMHRDPHAAHLLRRRRAHLLGSSPGAAGNPRRTRMPVESIDQRQVADRRRPAHPRPALPFADGASGDVPRQVGSRKW
jgi:hypothetical protein